MILTVLQIMGAVLGTASSILGVVSFLRDRIKHRGWFIAGAILLGGAATLLYAQVEQQRHDTEVRRLKEDALRRDAAVVSDAIVISGWEDVGDYVGYLAQITGFYQRHVDDFRSEHAAYSRQLDEWQDYLKKARESGRAIYSTDLDGLKGLVTSGEDQLARIARGHDR